MQYTTSMHNKKQIKDIVEVISGYTFRNAIQIQDGGKIFVIQAKNITDDIYIDEADLANVDYQTYRTNAFLKKNDVVISSRGVFRAGLVGFDVKNTIAASSVYILRVIDENIIPEYLVIYLNSLAGQKDILQKTTGGAIKTILRKDLEDLSVKVPSIEIQKQIIRLYQNNKKQEILLKRKILLINEIGEVILSKLLNK